ncbi:hypothetical protein Ancab_011900 [Ancistrocladus abbreviatus]
MNGDLATAVSQLFDIPEQWRNSCSQLLLQQGFSIIILVINLKRAVKMESNGKRKGKRKAASTFIRLVRRAPQKLMRKFRLLWRWCENGALTVAVEMHPPPPKPKTLQVAIS